MTHTMHYIKGCQIKINKGKKVLIPALLLLNTVLMIPLAGTNYLQIVFVYVSVLIVIFRNNEKIKIRDSNTRVYAVYYLVFILYSSMIGLLNGIGFRDEITDIITSSLPLLCLFLGNEFAVKYSEEKQYRLIAFLLTIEFLFGLGQTLNEFFRSWSFNLYNAGSRLRSYIAEDVGRAVGTIGSPNYFGLICVILGTFFICKQFEPDSPSKKFITLILSSTTMACVVFSVSKTSVICLGVVVILSVLFSPSLKTYQKIFCVLLCITAIIYLIPLFEKYSNRIIDISSMTGRATTWQRFYKDFFYPNPLNALFGFGNGYATNKTLGSYVDSYYIILLFEQGLVGALAYFTVWGIIITRIFERKAGFYRNYALTLIVVVLLADVTAAISDMPILCIVVYYMIGRYSRLSYLDDMGGILSHGASY